MKIWIVVANGGEAHILMRRKAESFSEVRTMRSEGSRRTSEMVSDRAGRAFSSVGAGRSAMEAPTDPQRHAKQVFAHEIAQMLKEEEAEYDRLVLVASPRMLGDLRAALDDSIRGRIIAEMNKDFTHSLTGELPEQLEETVHWSGNEDVTR
jgi:protein required for attachment to host cells